MFLISFLIYKYATVFVTAMNANLHLMYVSQHTFQMQNSAHFYATTHIQAGRLIF